MLRSETRLPILPVKTLGDKIARAHACSPLVESGRVFLLESAPWLRDFLDEVTSFPAAPHDDQVDALTMALNYLREHQYEPVPLQIVRSAPSRFGSSGLYSRGSCR
jgi:predicted phage terminase large subunit-like protein